jgi:hypothetical protein
MFRLAKGIEMAEKMFRTAAADQRKKADEVFNQVRYPFSQRPSLLFSVPSISELGRPPKLVSYRNNRNGNRNEFRHYPKQDVCFGCFALISKQGVSMFRNNRNKQKTNRNNSIFVKKINLFISPHSLPPITHSGTLIRIRICMDPHSICLRLC